MDSEDNRPGGGLTLVDAPFARHSLEAPLFDSFVERLIPYAAGLFHAIQAFHEPHDPVFFARGFEAAWLFHKHGFIGGEDAVKESGFDIKVLKVPIKGGSKMENGTEGFKADGGGCSFIIVNAVLLGETFGDVTDFVSNNVA